MHPTAQLPLQLPVQVPEHPVHLLLQIPEQPPVQPPEHEFSHPIDCISVAFARIGELTSAIAPITGNAFLAASLKNSLRDWSSSFSLLCFIF